MTLEETAAGCIRPIRDGITHLTCGTTTIMTPRMAKSFARAPSYYRDTKCYHCNAKFPIGQGGQFVWSTTQEKVGT